MSFKEFVTSSWRRSHAIRARPAADRKRPLDAAEDVTAFTVAHSITLAIATLGYAEVPKIPNAAIALSILFLGPEIVRSWRGETKGSTIRHPRGVAFAFGLLHGFGFRQCSHECRTSAPRTPSGTR